MPLSTSNIFLLFIIVNIKQTYECTLSHLLRSLGDTRIFSVPGRFSYTARGHCSLRYSLHKRPPLEWHKSMFDVQTRPMTIEYNLCLFLWRILTCTMSAITLKPCCTFTVIRTVRFIHWTTANIQIYTLGATQRYFYERRDIKVWWKNMVAVLHYGRYFWRVNLLGTAVTFSSAHVWRTN